MTPKLLVDMNLSPAWIPFLEKMGFAAAHWSTVGAGDATDAEIVEWARANSCVLLTCDLDFGAILAATQERRPSVIQVRSDNLSIGATGPSVVRAIEQTRSELEKGALVTVDAVRARVRILPLEEQ